MNKNLIKTGLISIGVSAILSTNLMAEERFLADSGNKAKSNDYEYNARLDCIVPKSDKSYCLNEKELMGDFKDSDKTIYHEFFRRNYSSRFHYSNNNLERESVEFEIAGVPGNKITSICSKGKVPEGRSTYANMHEISNTIWEHTITSKDVKDIKLLPKEVTRNFFGISNQWNHYTNLILDQSYYNTVLRQDQDPLGEGKLQKGYTNISNNSTNSNAVYTYREYLKCELDKVCKAKLVKAMKEKGYSTANLYGEKKEEGFTEPNENLLALVPDKNGKVSYEGKDYELNKDNGMYRGDLLCPNGDIGFYIEIYNPKIEKKMTFNSCEDGAKIGGESSFKKKEFTPKSLLQKKVKYMGARGVKNGKPIVEIESSMRKRFAIMGNFMKKDTQKEAE